MLNFPTRPSSSNNVITDTSKKENSHLTPPPTQENFTPTIFPKRPSSPQYKDFPLQHTKIALSNIVETIPEHLHAENIPWSKFIHRNMTMVSAKDLLEMAKQISPEDFENTGSSKKKCRPSTPSNLHPTFNKGTNFSDEKQKALLMCLSSISTILTHLRSEIKKMPEKQPGMPSALAKRTFAAAHFEIHLHGEKVLDKCIKTLSGGKLDTAGQEDYAPTVKSKDTELRPGTTYRVAEQDVAMAYDHFPAGTKDDEITAQFDRHALDAKRFFLQNKEHLKILLDGKSDGLSELLEQDINNQGQKDYKNKVTMFFRVNDAEFKILTQALADLDKLCNEKNCSREELHGVFEVFSEREYCMSCQNVLNQFSEKFPNLKLLLLSGGRKIRVDAVKS